MEARLKKFTMNAIIKPKASKLNDQLSSLIQRLRNAHLIIPPPQPLQLAMRPFLRDPPIREHKDDVRILDGG